MYSETYRGRLLAQLEGRVEGPHIVDWLTLDLAGKILLPISTFVFGIVVTLAIKRWEVRGSSERDHVQAVAKLANQWYNQIHELSIAQEFNPRAVATKRAASFYVENRLVLPEFLLHLEALRLTGKHLLLVQALDKFLSIVTTPHIQVHDELMRSYMCNTARSVLARTRNSPVSEDSRVQQLVRSLDQSLQQVVQLAGRELAP